MFAPWSAPAIFLAIFFLWALEQHWNFFGLCMLDAPGLCLLGVTVESSLGAHQGGYGAPMGAACGACVEAARIGRGGCDEASCGGCGGHARVSHGRATWGPCSGSDRAALHRAIANHRRFGLGCQPPVRTSKVLDSISVLSRQGHSCLSACDPTWQ